MNKLQQVKHFIKYHGKGYCDAIVSKWIDEQTDMGREETPDDDDCCMYHEDKKFLSDKITDYAVCEDCLYEAFKLRGKIDIIKILNKK